MSKRKIRLKNKRKNKRKYSYRYTKRTKKLFLGGEMSRQMENERFSHRMYCSFPLLRNGFGIVGARASVL